MCIDIAHVKTCACICAYVLVSKPKQFPYLKPKKDNFKGYISTKKETQTTLSWYLFLREEQRWRSEHHPSYWDLSMHLKSIRMAEHFNAKSLFFFSVAFFSVFSCRFVETGDWWDWFALDSKFGITSNVGNENPLIAAEHWDLFDLLEPKK